MMGQERGNRELGLMTQISQIGRMECVSEQEFLYKDLTYAIIGTTDGTDYTDLIDGKHD